MKSQTLEAEVQFLPPKYFPRQAIEIIFQKCFSILLGFIHKIEDDSQFILTFTWLRTNFLISCQSRQQLTQHIIGYLFTGGQGKSLSLFLSWPTDPACWARHILCCGGWSATCSSYRSESGWPWGTHCWLLCNPRRRSSEMCKLLHYMPSLSFLI